MASADKVGEQTALTRTEGGRFGVGNPGGPGRPKRGLAIGEQFRRAVNWEAVRQRLERIATGDKSKDADAITAARELLDRGWGRPLASHELHVSGERSESETDFSHLSIERRRAILAELQGGNPRLDEPQVTDDDNGRDT